MNYWNMRRFKMNRKISALQWGKKLTSNHDDTKNVHLV